MGLKNLASKIPRPHHFMRVQMDPASFSECLAGRADSVACDTALFTNRQRVLDAMDPALTGPNDAFIECIQRLVVLTTRIRRQERSGLRSAVSFSLYPRRFSKSSRTSSRLLLAAESVPKLPTGYQAP